MVLTAHAADISIAGNLAGVIAFLQDAVLVIAAYAADISIAGNLAGVVAVLQRPKIVKTADTAGKIVCAFYCTAGGTVLYNAIIVPADTADTTASGHIGIRDGDIFYGAALANVAEQANVVLIEINVQPADGVAAAVKLTFKWIVVCTNGRPLYEVVGVGGQAAVVV